ncbi:MAG: hypothetical protein ABR964_10190 [Tepidisphaeraceae bacterium]|jgi:serine/threonine-protein kinase RIO1
MYGLAHVLESQGKYAQAEQQYREQPEIQRKHHPAGARAEAEALAELLDQASRSPEAAAIRKKFSIAQPATQPSATRPAPQPPSN